MATSIIVYTMTSSSHGVHRSRGITVSFHQFFNRLRADERGEGVVSTAIAVLIMALIGAAMWLVFNGVFESASTDIENSVSSIGD